MMLLASCPGLAPVSTVLVTLLVGTRIGGACLIGAAAGLVLAHDKG